MSDMKKLFPVFAAVAALSNALFAQSATDMPELERSQFSMAFADVVYVVPADENGRSFLEERKRFRETLIRELEFDPAAPPHPTDYLRERVPGENE